MNCWQIAIKRGKYFLSRHDAESAVKTFSYALQSCPSCHYKELSKLLYYLGIAFKRLGFLNSALKVWIAANRLKKNKHIKKLIRRFSNGYGMKKQSSKELDDKRAFFSIQIVRYLNSKNKRAFRSDAERDMIFDLIEDHWNNLVKSGIILYRNTKEKNAIFHKVKIVFPFIVIPKVMGDRILKVDFFNGSRLEASSRCLCGSSLPFCMCCGRTPGVEEIARGIF